MLTRCARAGVAVVSLTALCLISGCSEDSAKLLGPEPSAARSQSGSRHEAIVEPRAIPRFSVDLRVGDQPRLNSPLRIAVSVTGMVPTDLARVVVSAPELEIARLSGGRLVDLPRGVRIPAILDRRLPMAAGQNVVFEGTLSISTPGYYRVTATASPVGEVQRFVGAEVVQDIVPVDTWIYVDEDRGTVTSDLDPAVVPDSVVAAPGPRTVRRSARPGLALRAVHRQAAAPHTREA